MYFDNSLFQYFKKNITDKNNQVIFTFTFQLQDMSRPPRMFKYWANITAHFVLILHTLKQTFKPIKECILEKSHLNVMFVLNRLLKKFD